MGFGIRKVEIGKNILRSAPDAGIRVFFHDAFPFSS
jgi:hypothetical protein